ncbi:MAG: carbamoyltransferase HypF [Dehalococcoidia bacterium]|nr:carbamoyltransferase HypF [Dehalococcoidia bacterium]
MSNANDSQRLLVKVYGVVQGVGFRPFIYQIATSHRLKGWVRNTSGYVEIDVEGGAAEMRAFLDDLNNKAPPAARIENVFLSYAEPAGFTSLEIRQSNPQPSEYQMVSPDLATCPECIAEIADIANRRYRYPFTNCTNCGPRFTIITDIPYDRSFTTMNSFRMCTDCRREYDDPIDRRFHAQPNACPVCGPQLALLDKDGKQLAAADPLSEVAGLLRGGKIVAVKGLGGFLLACDATNDMVVQKLRERKHRPSKPFAVMVRDIDAARELCLISETETALLASSQSPIVLLKMKGVSSLSCSVAPGLKYLGLMLPYTPLHHLLMRESGIPLVMTSGNMSEEPICKDNDEALRRLGGIADYFLTHNRDIYVRYDDSVAMLAAGEARLFRRARGYAPYPIRLPFKTQQILACGAEMKGAFCLTRDDHAFLSQHIGDMENAETLEHFQNTVEIYKKLFRIHPEVIAHDLHPDYLSTGYAQSLAAAVPSIDLVSVQHHHAHIAACMAENGVTEPVIGVALDGTGYGADGNIWGGEFLLADFTNCRRLAHLEYIPLPGGDAATRKPVRIAASYIYYLLGDKGLADSGLAGRIGAGELDMLKQQVGRGLNAPLTSSCGRLFDAVSALLGIRDIVEYEAQAAIELEMVAADAVGNNVHYPFDIDRQDSVRIIRLRGLFDAILKDIAEHSSRAEIAQRFHASLAGLLGTLCELLACETGVKRVALSGGVFQNRLLFEMAVSELHERSLEVITHRLVPCNDGGIALGQAAIAGFARV